MKVDILVIGGGFAGLSTAYHLAKSGAKNIVVIEQEKKLGGHASGRNAGMIRQSVGDPALAWLAREGRESLARASRNGWKNIDFAPNGSFLIAKGEGMKELARIADSLKKNRIPFRWFTKEEAAARVSFLNRGDFEKTLFCPSDAMVNIEALLDGFLKKLRGYQVPVYCGLKVRRITRKEGGFLVLAGGRKIFANKVVNAAGACAEIIGEKANATKIPFKAYRRHLFFSGHSSSFKKTWPFVWDLSHNFYFRPQGAELLLSPCDKTAVGRSYRAAGIERQDPRMKKKLENKLNDFSDSFRGIKIKSAKSGLRTMTPDGRFVVGEDPRLSGFFWVAGLGGHGLTTSFSVGRLASDLILRRKRESFLVKAFSPKRFLEKGDTCAS